MIVRRGQPGMGGQKFDQRRIAAQFRQQRTNRVAARFEQRQRVGFGRGEYHVILMRAQIAVAHQLGHADLQIDRPAQRFIARPFAEGRVIGRRRGQRDQPRIGQRVVQRQQRVPPFTPQVMRLIQHQRHRTARL